MRHRFGIIAAGIFVVLLALIFWAVRPFSAAQITEAKFQQYVRDKIQSMTGLQVTVGNVEYGKDLSFRLNQVNLGQPSDPMAPQCSISEISGRFAKRGFGWHFDNIWIYQPVCRIQVSEAGKILGLKPGFNYSFADARWLGGFRIDDLRLNQTDIAMVHLHSDGSHQEYQVPNLFLTAKGVASLLGMDLSVKIHGPADGMEALRFVYRNKDSIAMFANIMGSLELKLRNFNSARSQFQLGIAEQDLMPTYDSVNFPLSIQGQSEIVFDDEAKLKNIEVKIGDAVALDFNGRFYYTDKMQMAHVDLSNLKVTGSDRLRSLLGQETGQSATPLIEMQDSVLTATWDSRKSQDDFELKFDAPELKVHLNDNYQVTFDKTQWHLLTSSVLGHLKVPYKSKVSAEKMFSPAHGLTISDVYAAGEGNILNGTRIDFGQFAVGTKDVSAVSIFSGYFETASKERNLMLSGSIFQKLDALSLKNIELQGFLKGPFTLKHSQGSQEILFESMIDIEIDKAKAPGMEVADLKMRGPVKLTYDFNTGGGHQPDIEQMDLLQRYLYWYSQVNSELVWEAGSVDFSVPAHLLSAIEDDTASYRLRLEAGEGQVNYVHKAPGGQPHLIGKLAKGKGMILQNTTPITELGLNGGWSLSRLAEQNQLHFFLSQSQNPDMELYFDQGFQVNSARFSQTLLVPGTSSAH